MKFTFKPLNFGFILALSTLNLQTIVASQPDVKVQEEEVVVSAAAAAAEPSQLSAADEREKQQLLADLNLIITEMKHYFLAAQNEKPYIELFQAAIAKNMESVKLDELKDATDYLNAIEENVDKLNLEDLKALYKDFDPIAELFMQAPNRFATESFK